MIAHSDTGNRNRTAEDAYSFISEINKTAYLDAFLLCNQVLSKNPFTNNFLTNYMNNRNNGPISAPKICFRILQYYFRSFKGFLLYLAEFIIYYLNPVKYEMSPDTNELILVDTFFLLERIKISNNYSDAYFPGLKEILDNKGKPFAYLPMFFGSKKILHLQRVLKILKENSIPILCEYQLLSAGDMLHLFWFIISYPFHVLKFAGSLDTEKYGSALLKNELIYTLNLVTFNSFSRYLQGKKIARLPYKSIKVISWYENQVKDKGFYKGLREPSSKVRIYGAQLFLYSRAILNLIPDENEESLGIVPDKIIVNGPAFIPNNSRLNYHVGPSLRYAKIFNYAGNPVKKDGIVALLSYLKADTYNILSMLSQLKGFSRPIYIKLHPAVSFEEIKHLLPGNTIIVKEDIYHLFETAKIIIGSGSGALVEAVSLGIPVITIKNEQTSDCNYLAEYGKGVIWDEAGTVEELIRSIDKFDSIADENPEKIAAIAGKYREMFFCNPTEKNIISAFDL